MSDPVIPLPTGVKPCPICGKPATRGHQPFCSTRCAQIDLGRWLNGAYRVETEDDPDDPSAEEEPD